MGDQPHSSTGSGGIGTNETHVMSSRAAIGAVRAAVEGWEGARHMTTALAGLSSGWAAGNWVIFTAQSQICHFPGACATNSSLRAGRDRITSFRSLAG